MKSSLAPKKFREIVLQILYSLDGGNSSRQELIFMLMKELKVTEMQMNGAFEIAMLIFEKKEEWDGKLKILSTSYEFDRIGKVEKNILRLTLRDIEEKILPPAVIVAEAVRLTRKFSTDSAATFVQALVNSLIGAPHDASLPTP